MADVKASGCNPKEIARRERRGNFKKYRMLYIMVIPGILYFIIFKYIPLFGNIIAFQEYNIFKGIFDSDWAGLKNFRLLFQYGDFIPILKNTIIINCYDLLFGFTAPLILALVINDISCSWFRKGVQQVVYLPHFLSWTILGGIVITQLLSPSQGLINMVLKALGMDTIYFMTESSMARAIVVLAGIWKEMGWGTVVYLAAMTSIGPSLYEAASLDGAGKFKQLIHITLPGIVPVIVTLFLLRIGHFLDFGFERIWVFQNASNVSVLEIFDTYIYKAGLQQGRYSYTTAVGLFKSVVGFLLLYGGNLLSKKITGESLY